MNKGSSEIGVAIIGGGRSSIKLMRLFQTFSSGQFKACVVGVADLNSQAPGLVYAREHGYYTTNDYTDFYQKAEVELIIELTGVPEVFDHIYQTRPSHIKIIDHKSARLFWDIMGSKADLRIRSILESARDAFLVIDEQGVVIQFNNRAEKMFPSVGWKTRPLQFPTMIKEVFGSDLMGWLDGQENIIYRLIAYPGNDREFPAELATYQIEIEGQNCRVFSFRDVSERQQAQREISRLQHWENAFNNAVCAFGETSDLEQAITYTVQMIGELLNPRGVVVSTLDPFSRNFILRSVYQNSASPYIDYSKIKSSVLLPFVSVNLEAGNMIKIHNINTLPDPDRGTLASMGIKSLLGLPIIIQDKTMGALFVESLEKRFWSGDEINFLLSIVNIIQNEITRKDVERSLQESETLYQEIVDHSLTGIYIVQKHRLVFVNQCLADMFGYDPEEMINRDLLDFFHPNDRDSQKGALSGEQPGKQIIRAVKKDGKVFWAEYHNSLVTLKGKTTLIGNLLDVSQRIVNEQNMNRMFEAITMLAGTMVEQRDPYTAGHQRRVAEICVAIGKKMILSKFQLEGLRVAALLHDLGKFAVPIEILTKPGRLSSSEVQFIQLHSQLGAEILSGLPFPWDVSTIVMQHHERMDGSGYPARLRGPEISLEARILAVADVLEAMSSHRPYRASLGLESALQELKEQSGILYDGEVVEALNEILSTLDLSN